MLLKESESAEIHKLENLESIVREILIRNERVELEKKWERSSTRIILVAALTYSLMSLVFFLLNAENWYLGALVPTLGYLLSTLSLTWAKGLWLVRRQNEKRITSFRLTL